MTDVDPTRALSELGSDVVRVRLQAARILALHARPEDETALANALARETVSWIRSSLSVGLSRIRGETPRNPLIPGPSEDEELRAEVVIEVTGQLLHEIEPLLGNLWLRLESEWIEFARSQSDRQLQRIEDFMIVMRDLHSAAGVPQFEEVPLHLLAESLRDEMVADQPMAIQLAGPELNVVTDPKLISVAVRNGLRNAVEAVHVHNVSRGVIVLTWGGGAAEFFISILDNGPGVPKGSSNAFEPGTSSKGGHFGMGLVLARQAINSLGGVIELAGRSEGGARLEMRLPEASRS